MASEQWLFDNATAVAPGGVWTAVGSTYSLRNIYTNTIARTTTSPTPYQGAGCVADPTFGINQNAELWNAANTARIAGTVFYTDSYYFTGSQAYGSGLLSANGNDTYGQYIWTNVNNTTANNRIEANWYDVYSEYGALIGTAAVGAVPTNTWVRIQSKFETWGISSLRLFITNINGTSPDYTLTWGNPAGFTSYENANGMGGNVTTAWDDLKVDTVAYPTRAAAAVAKLSVDMLTL